MFEKLGHGLVRRRKSVLALFIVAIIVTGAVGSLVFARLQNGGYSDPHSDSAKAAKYLTDTFHVKDPAIVLIADAGKDIANPAVVLNATKLETQLSQEADVVKTLSYWSAGGAPTLRSTDGKAGYIFLYAKEKDPTTATYLAKRIIAKYDGNHNGFHI